MLVGLFSKMVRKMKPNNKGQSLVELSLILPLLILLLIGIIEFGRIFGTYIFLSHLSREGARYAATGQSDIEIEAYLEDNAKILGNEEIQLNIYPAEQERVRGESVCIRIDFDVKLYTPVLNSILPNPFHITTETTMRIE